MFSEIIRYASCWEDTENLLQAGEIKGKTCVSIISGGDNTLSLLTKDPAHVVGFDLNPVQINVLKLKMAAFRTLSYGELLGFLGITPCPNRLALFDILPLEDEVRKSFLASPAVIIKGVIHTGKFEHYFQMFRDSIIPLFSTQEQFRQFAMLDNTADQKEFFQRYINTKRFKIVCRMFFGAKSMGKFGRDKSFYRYVSDKSAQGDEIIKRFVFGISHTVNRTNPYLRYICTSNYAAEALPHYLRKENYEKIRRNLDRIEIRQGDLGCIKDVRADFFNLSDIFEYMSEFDFRRNTEIIKKMARPSAAVVYYNMQNKRYINDPAFELDEKLSQTLYRHNRSFFYRDFLIYRRVQRTVVSE